MRPATTLPHGNVKEVTVRYGNKHQLCMNCQSGGGGVQNTCPAGYRPRALRTNFRVRKNRPCHEIPGPNPPRLEAGSCLDDGRKIDRRAYRGRTQGAPRLAQFFEKACAVRWRGPRRRSRSCGYFPSSRNHVFEPEIPHEVEGHARLQYRAVRLHT